MNDEDWSEPRGLILSFHIIVLFTIPLASFLFAAPVLAILWFFVFFIIIGQSIRLVLFSRFQHTKWKFPQSVSARFAFDIILSITITSVLTIFTSSLYVLDNTLLPLWFLSLVFDIINLKQEKMAPDRILEEITQFVKTQSPLLASAIFGVFFILWRYSSFAWPEAPGTDLFVHEGVARLIVDSDGSNALITSYPYVFHALVALLSLSSGLDVHILLGYGSTFAFPLICMIAFAFFKCFTGNSVNSLLCIIIMNFIVEGGALLALDYMYPSTFAIVIFLLLMILFGCGGGYRITFAATIAGLVLLLLTYPNSILAVFPAFLYLLASSSKTETDFVRIMRNILTLGIVLGSLLILLYYLAIPMLSISIPGITLGPISIVFSDRMELAIALILQGYSFFLIPMILGLLILVREHFSNILRKSRYTRNDDFILFLVLFYLVVFFLPLEFAFRTEEFIRPLNSIVILTGISAIIYNVRNALIEIGHQNFSHLHFRKSDRDIAIMSFLIFVLLIPNGIHMFIIMQYEPKNPSADELNAFMWLRSSVPENGYVLTDPATGFFMRSFTIRNCSTSFIEGERFPSPLRNATLFHLLFQYFNATLETEADFYDEIQSNLGKISYVVVSSRSQAWLKQARENKTGMYVNYEENWNIAESDFSRFISQYYALVRQFGNVYIFRRQGVTTLYSNTFENANDWNSTSAIKPVIENSICYWQNSNDSSIWHHLYTNGVFFNNSYNQHVILRIKTNSTTLNARIFFYSGINRKNLVSYSDLIRPSTTESTIFIPMIEFYEVGVCIRSISIGFFDKFSHWKIELDFISIVEITYSE